MYVYIMSPRQVADHFGVTLQAVSLKFSRDAIRKLMAWPAACPHCGKPL